MEVTFVLTAYIHEIQVNSRKIYHIFEKIQVNSENLQ